MRKRLLNLLIVFMMVITILPAMSRTAHAEPTEELLTTITATAKEQASYSKANVATVSFSYTAGGSSAYHASWGWWGYGWIATVNAVEGYTITKCIFYDDANRTATDSETPFVVETTEQDKTPLVNGTPILAYQSKGITKIEVYGYVTPVPVTGVTLNRTTSQTIDIGGKVSFTATVSPDNATDKKVKWSVGGTDAGAVKLYSDAECTNEIGTDATETLTVYAKGESAGSATVTCTSNADSTKSASCDVMVNAAVTKYPLWVGGEQVTEENAANITGSETPVASYNAETNTLTLSGANITTGYMPPDQPVGTSFGIYYNNNNSDTLNIVLSGTNTIGGEDSSITTGISNAGPINISGEGSLIISASSTGITSAGAITISSGTVAVETTDESGMGIASPSLTINGGKVTAVGGLMAIAGGEVKNAIAGTGWTNTAGTEGKADIAINASASGQDLFSYKKVQFPAVHTHDFEYSVSSDGHSIIATCSAADCDLPDNKVTLTISANDASYTSSAYSGASLTNTDAWTAAGLTTPTIKYEGRSTTSYEESETAPTNVGSYTASITVEGKKATADFEVTKAAGTISYTTESITKSVDDKTPFTNILTNTGDGAVTYASDSDVVTVDSGSGMVTINKGGTATITATVEDGTNYTYENKTASYTVTVNKKTPTTEDFHYSDPGDNEYDGNPKSKYVDPDEAQGVTGMGVITVYYYSDPECTAEVEHPTDVGTYYVGITVTEGDNYTASSSVLHDTDWKFTITKTNPNKNDFIYSEPSDLQYNGNAKTATVVSKEGIAGMGTVTVKYYSDETRTTEVSPVNAGTYYVGIEVAEGDNYNATTAVIYDNSWSFTIAKADPTAVAPTGLTATYGQTLGDIEITNPTGNTPGTWAWTDSSTSVGNAGSNTFKANFTPEDTDNYNSVSGIDVTVTVGQATQTITAQDVIATFGDTGVKVEATTTGDGKISYAVKSGSEEYIDVMTETGELSLIKAGTGTIVVTAAATENYEEASKEITVTINKADSTPATVNANNRTYDGTEQALITVEGEPTGGTMYYCIGEDEETPTAFDTEIPKATDAKTYYVFYHVKGDDNHKDTEPVCVTVTISPVDKTALNEKINEAEEYYNSIKDNDDYKEVADTLKEAIDNAKAVADDDNQTKAQVDEATTTLNDALDKAKKDVEDIDAANEVADMVSKLPNPNDVTTADKDAIEAARKAYDNLTPEQKAKLPVDTKDKLEQVEEALKEAQDQEAADKVADMVSKLPNPNDVTKDDKDAVEAARKDYNNLTPEQKAKLPVDTKDKLEQVEEALFEAIEGIKYSNIEGDGSSWVKGSTSGDTFIFKRNVNDHKTFNEFDGIKVDGNTVATSNYSYKEGSVIINLNPSYLETLSVGDHTLTAMFKDGNDVTVSFKVLAKVTPTPSDNKKYTVPKTGID